MKIILLTDIKTKGKKNDVIMVKDGYAKFLIDNKKAIMASSENLRGLARTNARKAHDEEVLIEKLSKIKTKLEKEILNFNVKTGASDKVFGSVSAKQIEKALKDKGYEIDKKSIIIETPLSCLGVHNVKIQLHKKVIAQIKAKLTK